MRVGVCILCSLSVLPLAGTFSPCPDSLNSCRTSVLRTSVQPVRPTSICRAPRGPFHVVDTRAVRTQAAAMAEEDFLQQFYRKDVFRQGEEGDEDWRTQRSYKVVKDSVGKLIEWLYQSTTGLYSEKAKDMGSHRQGLHLQSYAITSDFDFLIPLRYNPTLKLLGSINVTKPSCYEMQLPTNRDEHEKVPVFCWGSKLVVDLVPHCDELSPRAGDSNAEETDPFKENIPYSYLDPVRILKDLHKHVHKALTADENSHPRENDELLKFRLYKPRVPQISKSIKERITLLEEEGKSPAVQLIFHQGKAEEVKLGKGEKVSVDLVPAIHDKVVVSKAWLKHDLARLSDWWHEEPINSQGRFCQKQKQVKKVGPDIVAKHGFWRFSFASVETALLQDVDCDGGQQREALRLLKFINNEYLVPEYGKLLTSYHLKTVLLWARDIHPEKEEWATLQSSLRNLVSILRHCVEKGELPHYFLRGFNLFNKRYKEGDGFYERLARQILTKEVALMELDLVQYICLCFSMKVFERSEDFSEAASSLWAFKLIHQRDLRELKRLEAEEQYELEEVCHPAGRQQDQKDLNLYAVLAEMRQCPGPSPCFQGEAKESVSAASEQVTFHPDPDQEIQAPREGPVQTERSFAETVHPVVIKWCSEQMMDYLTLDPTTAHPLLEITWHKKEVRCGSFPKDVPAGPRRFDTANCVVAKQSFQVGRHYWDVSVGRKQHWNLGVVSDSAERRGRLIWRKSWLPWFGEACTEGYWMIGYNQQKAEKPYWAFDTNPTPFDCSHRPQTVRVYLDYEAGEVSFYGADDPSNLIRLFSFYHADFKGAPVYPLFDPCWQDEGGNTEPLKIL